MVMIRVKGWIYTQARNFDTVMDDTVGVDWPMYMCVYVCVCVCVCMLALLRGQSR